MLSSYYLLLEVLRRVEVNICFNLQGKSNRAQVVQLSNVDVKDLRQDRIPTSLARRKRFVAHVVMRYRTLTRRFLSSFFRGTLRDRVNDNVCFRNNVHNAINGRIIRMFRSLNHLLTPCFRAYLNYVRVGL